MCVLALFPWALKRLREETRCLVHEVNTQKPPESGRGIEVNTKNSHDSKGGVSFLRLTGRDHFICDLRVVL